jgi:hypothetical protein
MGRRPKPRQKLFEKSFLDFQKLLSAKTCGFGRITAERRCKKRSFLPFKGS